MENVDIERIRKIVNQVEEEVYELREKGDSSLFAEGMIAKFAILQIRDELEDIYEEKNEGEETEFEDLGEV